MRLAPLNRKTMDIQKGETFTVVFYWKSMAKGAAAFFITFIFLFHASVLFSEDQATRMSTFWQTVDEENNFLSFSARNEVSSFQEDENQRLDGILASGFDPESCLSRYRFTSYHKRSSRSKPSPFLVSKLRDYENRHRRCGPHTEGYNRTVHKLDVSDNASSSETGCSYVIWDGFNGLGNRMLSMASTFLYAVLTNRIMLVRNEPDMVDLFCEPFLGTSWLLPPDFPMQHKLSDFHYIHLNSYGTLLKNSTKDTSTISPPPSSLFLYLSYDYDESDKLFYLDENQGFLRQVPWLILVSDQYFAPYLFTMRSFNEELDKLFPVKESTFHHLGRYLFHPSNQVWGLITRFFHAYLDNSDERIGLQIRVVDPKRSPSNLIIDQLLTCAERTGILPPVDDHVDLSPHGTRNKSSKTILITSLDSVYYQTIQEVYLTKETLNGEIVRVHQPSHEEYQHFGDVNHNIKALADIYLLSTSDVLLTTSWSTFGYVAQGLAGLTPWIMYVPQLDNPSPMRPCRRAISMDPCFHYPPYYDKQAGVKLEMNPLRSFHRYCEDAEWGLKLVG